MPTPGLSLVGFLEEPQGIALLRNSCVVADPSDAALAAEWRAARGKLGAPAVSPGLPDMHDIPQPGQGHMAQLLVQPWLQGQLQAGVRFQMVELDPLLAFQFNVDVARSDHHNAVVAGKPDLATLLNMCLPVTFAPEGVRVDPGPSSMLITSDGLNFMVHAQGLFPTQCGNFVGIQVGTSLPLLHVVRYNGRCYLHNGFHRAVGLSRRGVTHAPCIVRDVADPESAGIRSDGLTFGLGVLESDDPPTVGHFAKGRAYDVSLKVFTRTIHVSWADHVTTRD